jgi:hypothetical protein
LSAAAATAVSSLHVEETIIAWSCAVHSKLADFKLPTFRLPDFHLAISTGAAIPYNNSQPLANYNYATQIHALNGSSAGAANPYNNSKLLEDFDYATIVSHLRNLNVVSSTKPSPSN